MVKKILLMLLVMASPVFASDNVIVQTADGNAVSASNPLAVTFGTGNQSITGDLTVSGTTTTNDLITKSPVADVRAYGAFADGIVDDTNYIQAAINTGLPVYLPKGTYKVSLVILPDNGVMFGDGIDKTVIIRASDNTDGKGIIYSQSASGTDFIDNIRLSDFTIYGSVDTLAFSEKQHLVSLNGVKDALIERVKLKGFRGDGIYVGAGYVGTEGLHNINVTIKECVFDGLNSDNRNGVSVIDGDNVKIINNTFRNVSRSTMPGAIDFEPNTAGNILKNLIVKNNTIESYGGGAGIQVYNTTATTAISNINIADNTIYGATKASASGIYVENSALNPLTVASFPLGLNIERNYIYDSNAVGLIPLKTYYTKGANITDNSIYNGGNCLFGVSTVVATSFMDSNIKNNNFYTNGTANGALTFGSSSNVNISGNTIQEPNKGTSLYGILFLGNTVTTVSDGINITGNTFIKGSSQTYSVAQVSHTFTQDSNSFYSNYIKNGTTLLTNFLFNNNLALTPYSMEKEIPIVFSNGVANQKIDLYIAGTQTYFGQLEVLVSGGFNSANNSGYIKKVYGVGLSAGGTIQKQETRYSESLGLVAANFAIDDVSWDAVNSRYKITIVHRTSTGNTILVKVKAIANTAVNLTNINTMVAGSVYTTDTTIYPQPFENFIGNVGIGTTAPQSLMEVDGKIYVKGSATTARIDISDSTVYGYVGRDQSSQRFDLGTFSNDAIGFETNNTLRATISANGNIGIGTTAPQASFEVDGSVYLGKSTAITLDGAVYYNSANGHFMGRLPSGWKQLDN